MTQLKDTFSGPPTDAQGFLGAAEAMLEGARPLLSVVPLPAMALTLLCGHGTEAGLKALLAQSGIPTDKLRDNPYRHDLVYLWNEAIAIGFPVTAPRPKWVDDLKKLHADKYKIRYPLGFHAMVLPNQQLLVSELERLVAIGKAEVR